MLFEGFRIENDIRFGRNSQQGYVMGTVVLVYRQLLYFPPFILLSVRAAALVNFSRPLHFSVLLRLLIISLIIFKQKYMSK